MVRNNVLVVDFPQQRYLADGAAGKSLSIHLDQDLFQCHCFFGAAVHHFVHLTVGTLTYDFLLLEVADLTAAEALVHSRRHHQIYYNKHGWQKGGEFLEGWELADLVGYQRGGAEKFNG